MSYRLYLDRAEGPSWLRLLALAAWVRGGIVAPEALALEAP